MEAERLRVTETVGKVVRKGGSLYSGKKKRDGEKDIWRETERERQQWGEG